MNKRYFAGNTLASFIRSSTDVIESTASGWHDSSYVSNSINVVGVNTSSFIRTPYLNVDAGEVWFRFDYRADSSSGSDKTFFQAYDSSGSVYRIVKTATSFRIDFWTGSSWDTGTSGIGSTLTALQTICIMIDTQNGVAKIFIDGAELSSASRNGMTGSTTIDSFSLSPTNNVSAACRVSQVMCANYDLRDDHYMQVLASGNGHYTDGTGDYTSIDEVMLDDSDAITLPAVGSKKTFTKPAITVPSGLMIASAVVGVRGRASGGIVDDGKALIRSGSTDGTSDDLAFAEAYEPRVALFENDPATTTAWSQSGFNSMQFGVEAV